MKLIRCLSFMFFLAASLARPAGAETAVPVSIVNYSTLPVHATAVALDEKMFDGKLGLPPGTPLRVRAAGKSAAIPMMHGTDGFVRIFVSLPAKSQLDLVAERAEKWADDAMVSAAYDSARQSGEIRNGVVAATLGKKGWNLSFDGAGTNRPALIKDGVLDFWVDNQNRGRIANGNPKDMGLLQFSADARAEKCEASVSPDGRPAIRRVSRFGGFAKDFSVVETFELVPGLPLLICRVRWQNDGDAPLWIAYVGSGDGIRGRWSKDLMPTPLIERKKSPLAGDLNGGETRPAWIGQLCRITMESPATGCGVGMSTLLPTPGKVGQGSMIWGCSGSGFQCNFIDPTVGQFPFLVKPHSALDNGFEFLAEQTGVSVHRETVALWTALQKEKLPQFESPCAVFVAGEPVYMQTVGGIESNADRQIALRLDFNKHFECRVAGATKVVARGKKAVTLLETNQPVACTIDLNERLGWKDEVPFVLETSAGTTVSIVETLPESPKMLSPVADADFTDLAAMFRWYALPMVVDYELQYSRTADFASPVDLRLTSSEDYPWYLVPDDRLPAPGKWYWRLRGMKGGIAGGWSETRAFTVNNDHATKPPKRPLTAKNPLFTLEATRVLDFTSFHPDVPADIAPYVGIIAEGMEGKGVPVTEFARGMEKMPHAIMLRSHWVGLADIEWLFQHVPNFVGIQGGEHLSDLFRESPRGEMRYAHRLLQLCAKYGMIYQEADGTYKDDKWQEMMDEQGKFVREYGRWLVLSQKNNIIRRQFYSQSAAMGLWLGGVTYGHGAWEDGGFYWQNAGFKELGVCAGERSGVLSTMPRIFWDLVCVMGIARGCDIYSLDGQTLMTSAKLVARSPESDWKSGIWYDTGKTTETFKRFVAPLIRGAVQHGLIPTKEEVLQNVKLSVFNDKKTAGDAKTWTHYVEYGPLYAGTYGFRKMGNIDGQLFEFFPNTGRYYFIPVLPQGNEPLAVGVRNLPVSELQDTAKVTETFNAAYPKFYDGDACVWRVGDTLAVMNSHENEDVTESYSLPLAAGAVTKLSGKIAPHSYLIGKIENRGGQLWLQMNTEYPDRDAELTFACSRKPDVKIEPASAAKQNDWDASAGTLKLRLSNQQGAVEVEIK